MNIQKQFFLFLLAGLLTCRMAAATPGDLDTTFGNGGVVEMNLNPVNPVQNSIVDLAVQTDGKIVGIISVSGDDFSLVRYLPNGQLDPTFGRNGVASMPPNATSMNLAGNVFILSGGKILVGGAIRDNLQWPGLPLYSHFALFRFNADGSPDGSFGNNGVVTTAVEGAPVAYVSAMDVMADGRIVLVGYCGGYNIAVARYLPDGTLDTTFDQDGVAVTILQDDQWTNDVQVQPDGKILISGRSGDEWGVLRLNETGMVDGTFGQNGFLSVAPNSPRFFEVSLRMVLQGDGKIVLVLNTIDDRNFRMFRFNGNGSVDNTFGQGGTVVTQIPLINSTTTYGGADAVILQSDGKILVAGDFYRFLRDWDFLLVRYQADGSLDTGFGSGGFVTTDLGWLWEGALVVKTQPDGKILVGGYRWSRGMPGPVQLPMAIIRYLGR